MTDPQITIVVTPRERFSYTRESLESIYQYTTLPFKLIYVDGNAPQSIRQYLETQSREKNFQLIRTDYYLFPNRARNIGLAQVNTPYVVFIDNDVVVAPGWLEALVQCAESTGAAVVGPLMCQYLPVHEVIHFAGGESRVIRDIKNRNRLREKMYRQGQRVTDVRAKLKRTETELCEFHCMLVRTAIFEQVGQFDEQMLNTKEHLDFCMKVRQVGGSVYFEPDSVATYVPPSPIRWVDLHFYMLRWSDAWELHSLTHLRETWNLAEDAYFKQKYKALGWRRRKIVLMPIVRTLTLGINNRLLEKVLMFGVLAPLERALNRYLTTQYFKHLPPLDSKLTPTLQPVVQQAVSKVNQKAVQEAIQEPIQELIQEPIPSIR